MRGESRAEANGVASGTDQRGRIDLLLRAMTDGLVERDEAARLVLLAALAGEHVLLVGPPGTAKSELARRLQRCVTGGGYFERLLTRFTVPEELFGPLSIRALERDEYHRLTDGYLPSASVAFLDEIFKANSAILNALLTLLNEREFDNGRVREGVPLVSVVAASNEIPEGPELGALFDRFLVRYRATPVSDGGFASLLALIDEPASSADPFAALSADDLASIRRRAQRVVVPGVVQTLLGRLRVAFADQELYVSDRRWRKIVGLLRVAAFTEGRGHVSLSDCLLIEHCVWERPDQIELVAHAIESFIETLLVEEPARYHALADAFDATLEADRTRRVHVTDAEGRPLFVDEIGQHVPEPIGRKPRKTESGDPLYRVPHPALGGPFRALTIDELWKDYFEGQPNGFSKLEAWIANPINKAVEEIVRSPVIDRCRHSVQHIGGRARQVESVMMDLRAFIGALDAESSDEVSTEHVWLGAAQTQRIRGALLKARMALSGMEERLAAVRDGFVELPRSEP